MNGKEFLVILFLKGIYINIINILIIFISTIYIYISNKNTFLFYYYYYYNFIRYGMTEIGMAIGNPYRGPRIPVNIRYQLFFI